MDPTLLVTIIVLLLFTVAVLTFVVVNLLAQKKYSALGIEAVKFLIVGGFLALPVFAYFFPEPLWLPWVIVGVTALTGLVVMGVWLTKIKVLSGLDDLIHKFWHWDEKSFSGIIFADYANTIGVLGGLGAYAYFGDDPALTPIWWWIGVFGAFLAIVVSFGSLWRWVMSDGDDQNVVPASGTGKIPILPGRNDDRGRQKVEQFFTVVTNFGVGTFVFISLILSEKTGSLWEQTSHSLPWLIFLIEMLVFLLLYAATFASLIGHLTVKHVDKRMGLKLPIVLGIVGVTLAIFLLLEIVVYITDFNWNHQYIANTFGMIGILFWMAAEGFSIIFLVRDWRHEGWFSAYRYLGLEKSMGQFFGALATFVFLLILQILGFPEEQPEYLGLIFIVGAVLGTLGTLRGVARGFLNQAWKGWKDQEEKKVKELLAELSRLKKYEDVYGVLMDKQLRGGSNPQGQRG